MKKSVKIFSFAALCAAIASCYGNGQGCKTGNGEITAQSDNFIAADTVWQDAGGGAVRQVLGYNNDIMMVKVKFDKGDTGAMHSHPHSQVTYVAAGKFEFTIGGVTKVVVAGDALYQQPNVEHGCVCLEDGLLIDCFSPMRDNFIAK